MGGYIPERSPSGATKVAITKSDEPSTTIISHDWCNPTTWYQDSVRIQDEQLVQEGVTKVYGSSKTNWIDLSHGNLTDEDDVSQTYLPVVKDGEATLTEGTDFTIDYKLGKVTISDSYTVQNQIIASFNYATTATYKITPTAGKSLILNHAELNFTKDCIISYPLNFEVWVGNPSFNPELPESESNPLRVLYKIKKYKNEKDVINGCNLGQGFIPKFGNLSDDVLVFPFNYVTYQMLNHSQLAEIRITMGKDAQGQQLPLPGSFATVSMYIISKTEQV